jgi:nucleoside-diphosphate-sugar epimerase
VKNMKTKIDRTKPVLVTGATGYVASWLVKKLLEEGLTVHAAVRDPENKEKVAHLDRVAEESAGTIRYFKSDLLEKGSYADAMKGCELVYHTASPFVTDVADPQRDLIDPAVKGTENVPETANATPGVKRVVVTSSCAAIYADAIECQTLPEGKFTEAVWNNTASLDYQPYSYSKTLAEKKAWEIAGKQSRWDLVTINPSLVLGPPLNLKATNSDSFTVLKQLGDGSLKFGAPRMGIGLVDVRDVAEAHFAAGFNPGASGRYITSGHETNVLELAHALKPRFGSEYPIPDRALPKWLLMFVGPVVNKLLSRRFIRNNIDVEWKADNSKIKEELGITFRPLEDSVVEGFQALVDQDVLKRSAN